MFRAIFTLLIVLWASNPTEIWAKQTEERGADTSAAQNQSVISLGPLAAEWARQPKINFEPYQFQPGSYYQSRQSDDAFLGISSGLWVAIFTFCLVLATVVQACLILRAEALTRAALRISQRQMVRAKIESKKRDAETQNALTTAATHAQAALEQARALNRQATIAAGVQLPRLMLFQLDFDAQGNASWWARLQYPRIQIVVKNYGRTPAFVLAQGVEMADGILPDEPDYSRLAHDLPPETIVEANETYRLADLRPKTYYTVEQVEKIAHQKRYLWAFGYVTYGDFLGELHVCRFCKRLAVLRSDNATAYRWVDARGEVPAAYTESF